MLKDFTVKPYDCTLTQATSPFWVNGPSPTSHSVIYSILSPAYQIVEPFGFGYYTTACAWGIQIKEESSPGSGTWAVHDGSELTVAYNPAHATG